MIRHLRYGIRRLLHTPGFTVAAVVTMALGIGANVAVFSVLNASMFRPLPYSDPDKVVLLWETKQQLKSDRITVAAPNYEDWRQQNHVFHGMALVKGAAFHMVRSGEATNVQGLSVTADFFRLLGVNAKLGRTFIPDETGGASSRVVVLSDQLWRNAFSGDHGIVGQRVALDDGAYTVIGVMPADFYFPEFGRKWDLWIPAALTPGERTSRDAHVGGVVARLRPGVTARAAQDEMDRIAARLEQDFSATNAGAGVRIIPIADAVSGGIRPTLIAMFGAVGLVLLIACSNVASLLLVRSASRRKEIGIRLALGARRRDLLLDLLTESLLLAGLGGAAGVFGAWVLLPLLKQIPMNIPRLDQVNLDAHVLLFAVGISVACGLLFGLAPAFRFARPSEQRRGVALESLVVAEIALAFILLAGAGLLMASLQRVLGVDPGFRPDNLLTAHVSLSPKRYQQPEQRRQFQARILEAVRLQPGVSAAALTTNLPIGGRGWSTYFSIEGRPVAAGEVLPGEQRVVSSGYFETMGIPLVAGRVFHEDDGPTSPAVAVINDVLAKRFFPGENPIGHRVKWGRADDRDYPDWFTIVGVVGSVRHRALESATSPELYMCSQQRSLAPSDFAFVMRTDGSVAPLIGAVRANISGFDPEVPVTDLRTMDQVLATSLAPRKFNLTLFSAFAGLALVLAWIGTYGIIAYSTAMRTREIGIRIALGADRGGIVRLVISQGMRLAAIGTALGFAGAWFFTRSLSSLLYGISPQSTGVLFAAALTVSTAAFVASYLPARRAAGIDPSTALRSE